MEFRRTAVEHGCKLELLVDERAVSRLYLFDLGMRVAGIPMRCGGIGGVHTERDQRMHGYSRSVLQESLAVMRSEGYELSALFGIPDYYHRFGFASALVEAECTVWTRNAELAQPRYAVREFEPRDARPIAELYEAHTAPRSGAIVRDPATWKGIAKGAEWTDRVGTFVVEEGERLLGYASYNLDARRFSLGEVGAADASVYGTLLAEAARRAVAQRVERVVFCLPPDDPFGLYCRRYGAEFKLSYTRCAGGMVRIIDQSAVLHKVQPVLALRLACSALAGWQGALRFETDLGTDTLAFGAGGPTLRVALSQGELTQLLLGYRPVADLLFEGAAQVDADAAPLLDALFPPGHPYVWMSDRF
ncbi:MAG: GNAT family N-acetyltransferase [Chloroflexi bacterium]|nr:GNAT family N-acetyltransferase [Chloroflexota bacterium]